MQHLARRALSSGRGRYHHWSPKEFWLEQGLRIKAISFEAPPHSSRTHPMWVARDRTVLLLDVHPHHANTLDLHWDTYNLSKLVGSPGAAVWGTLDQLQDHRRKSV